VTPKQVFIVSNHAMFGKGLDSLLGQKEHIDIVGQENNLDRALDQVTQLQPDVLILDSDDPPYESLPAVLYRILKDDLDIKVIGLSLQDNRLYIYMATHWVVTDVDDLISAIFREETETKEIGTTDLK